jgi:hypothetical protein
MKKLFTLIGTFGCFLIILFPCNIYSIAENDFIFKEKHFLTSEFIWNTPAIITYGSSNHSEYPSSAFGSDGSLHVVWENYGKNIRGEWPDRIYYASRSPNGQWSTPELISVAESNFTVRPVVVVDTTGTIYVAWIDAANYSGYGELPKVVFRKKISGGTWSGVEVISTDSINNIFTKLQPPSLAVDSLGNIHVTWYEYTNFSIQGPAQDMILYKNKQKNGGWSYTERISPENLKNSMSPSLAVDSSNAVHLTWENLKFEQTDDGGIFYRVKPLNGNWSAVQKVTTEGITYSYNPSVAIDSDLTVHVSWSANSGYGGSGEDEDIFYKNKGVNQQWNDTITEVVSSESNQRSAFPSLAIDQNGIVHVAWMDWTDLSGSSHDANIFYKTRSTSGVWTTVEVVSWDFPATSTSCSLAIDKEGFPHVVWQDNSNYSGAGGNYHIVWKTRTALLEGVFFFGLVKEKKQFESVTYMKTRLCLIIGSNLGISGIYIGKVLAIKGNYKGRLPSDDSGFIIGSASRAAII